MDSEEFAEPLGTPKPYSRQGFILANLNSIKNNIQVFFIKTNFTKRVKNCIRIKDRLKVCRMWKEEI